jgi:MFS family permease
VAWITYGSTTNLTLFLVVSVIEGFAVAWSYPAKAAFLVRVVPPRWLGSVQGLEQTFIQIAGLIGTLTAPFLYEYISGYVISLAGVISIVGLTFAAPVLLKVWRGLEAAGDEPRLSSTLAQNDD